MQICTFYLFSAFPSHLFLPSPLFQEFSLDMFFRQRWKDERFAYRPIPEKGPDQRLNLSPKITKLPWRPDLFFKNSKKASFHYVPTENILFGIRPEGDVILSTRYERLVRLAPVLSDSAVDRLLVFRVNSIVQSFH